MIASDPLATRAERHAMVSSQLRTNAVSDNRVVAAMASIPRERFLPPETAHIAYRDTAIPLGRARAANPPLATARLLTEAELTPADREGCAPLLDRAFAELAAARSAVRTEVEADAYLAALDRTVAAIAAPAWVDGDVDAPVTRLARRPFRRLREHVATMDAADPAQLHRMRILAKRARYAADACVPAVGEPAAACAQRLADVQTVLGNHHDASVTREWLERQAREAPELAFPAGELAAHEGARMRDAGSRWRAAWRAASRRRDWRWLRG